MSTGKILVIVSDGLAAVGLLVGVVLILGFFAYAAIKEPSATLPAMTPIANDFSPALMPSTSPVLEAGDVDADDTAALPNASSAPAEAETMGSEEGN